MVPLLPEHAIASGSTAEHAPSKSPDFRGSDFDRRLTSAHQAGRAHSGEVASGDVELVVDDEAGGDDGHHDPHRLHVLRYLLDDLS